MSADVISLVGRRRRQPVGSTVPCPPPEVARLPLVVQGHPGAVALHLPDAEFWLTPDQARAIAADLLVAAESSEGSL